MKQARNQRDIHRGLCGATKPVPRTMGEAFGHEANHTITEQRPASTWRDVLFAVMFFSALAALVFFGNDLHGIVWGWFK